MLDQGFFVIPLLLLVALGSLVRRWRASSGVERLQYPWLMTAIAFVIVMLVITQLVPESVILDVSLVFIALNAIPAAIGVAILRYRLYDIDKLISRTVSYAVVAAVLVAVYAGSILALGSLVGRGNPLAVAGATLASAALFTPVRRRVQAFIDRRFDRARYDAAQEVDDVLLAAASRHRSRRPSWRRDQRRAADAPPRDGLAVGQGEGLMGSTPTTSAAAGVGRRPGLGLLPGLSLVWLRKEPS